MTDRGDYISDYPNVWTEVDDLAIGRFRQCWVPGAFPHAARDIGAVAAFRVIREVWNEETDDGIPERMILQAEITALR